MRMKSKVMKRSVCGLLATLSLLTTPAVVIAKGAAANAPVAGTLRITGDGHLSPVLKQWRAALAQEQPALQFTERLSGNAAAIYGLETWTSDLALMSRGIHPFERYGTYERSWIFPVEIEVGTGSATSAAHAGAYVIVTHKENPLQGISVEQLDRVFSGERGGGWRGLEWNESAVLDASDLLRTWDQLGVSGTLSGKRITPYGQALQGAGVVTDFQAKVMQGGSSWNGDYREYVDDKAMLAALSRDPQGIGYTTYDQIGDAPVKVIGVAKAGGNPHVMPDAKSVAERRYPLYRAVYAYYTIDTVNGDPKPVDPKVREFVRHALSAKGQLQMASTGHYYPLPADVLQAQVDKLEDNRWPAERPRP